MGRSGSCDHSQGRIAEAVLDSGATVMKSKHFQNTDCLLQVGELAVPKTVVATVELLDDLGIWFRLSRNREARSCRDAAHKRARLGREGIPLWDELKSFLGQYRASEGDALRPFLAHIRADRVLNFEAVARALGAAGGIERVAVNEEDDPNLDYGLINPFGSALTKGTGESWQAIPQIFDAETIEPLGVPGTMMTNAGDLTWAVEFRAAELVDALPNKMIAKIAREPDDGVARPAVLSERRPIGILSGNGPETGLRFWLKLNDSLRTLLGRHASDLSMPPIHLLSLPEMGLSMELDAREDEVWSVISTSVHHLIDSGARFITLPDNTTPYFAPRIRELCEGSENIEFLSMPEVVGQWLVNNGIRKVALLGITYVADLAGPWSAYSEALRGIEVEQIPQRMVEETHAIAYRVKNEGWDSNYGLNRLRDILGDTVESDVVLVALTELSILLDRAKVVRKGKTLIDPLTIYAEFVARHYVGPDPL